MKRRLTVSSYVTNFAEEEYDRSIFFFVKREYLRVGGWISGSPPDAKRCLVSNPNSAETSTHQSPKFNC